MEAAGDSPAPCSADWWSSRAPVWVHRVWLHATADGRPLYEDRYQGFQPNPTAMERILKVRAAAPQLGRSAEEVRHCLPHRLEVLAIRSRCPRPPSRSAAARGAWRVEVTEHVVVVGPDRCNELPADLAQRGDDAVVGLVIGDASVGSPEELPVLG